MRNLQKMNYLAVIGILVTCMGIVQVQAQDKEISTPVAFIQGKIEVNGIPETSRDQVTVFVESVNPQGQGNSVGFWREKQNRKRERPFA